MAEGIGHCQVDLVEMTSRYPTTSTRDKRVIEIERVYMASPKLSQQDLDASSAAATNFENTQSIHTTTQCRKQRRLVVPLNPGMYGVMHQRSFDRVQPHVPRLSDCARCIRWIISLSTARVLWRIAATEE